MGCNQGTAISLLLLISILAGNSAAAAEPITLAAAVTSTTPTSTVIDDSPLHTADGRDIDRLFLLYEEARSAAIDDESDSLAKWIVTASIEAYGFDSMVTAHALTNLAMLQAANDESTAAAQNFTTAIEIVERVDNRLSADLIAPLKGLGAAYVSDGQPDRAGLVLHRALHLSHVNFGPHNYEQVETLLTLAHLLATAGMSDEALKVRKRISYLHARQTQVGDSRP